MKIEFTFQKTFSWEIQGYLQKSLEVEVKNPLRRGTGNHSKSEHTSLRLL